MTPIDTAREIVTELEGRLEAAKKCQSELNGELERIALAAETGQLPAQKRKAEIRRKLADAAFETQSLTAAIAAARRRVTELMEMGAAEMIDQLSAEARRLGGLLEKEAKEIDA